MITALIVIAILVLLIVAHELGHFVAAKILGVRVQEFGVGYPPRAITFGTIGETEYTLNWIPFGGFVRLFGDEGEAEHGKGSFVDANRGVQAAILVAGVFANAAVAWALFAIALHLGVPQAVAAPLPNAPVQLIVADVVPGSPASAAGISAGDEITNVTDDAGGTVVGSLSPDSVAAFVEGHIGESVEIDYVHAGVREKATMKPAQGVLTGAAGQPAVGIALVLVAKESLSWPIAALGAFSETADSFKSVGASLWGLVRQTLHGAPDLSGIVGPVGIVGYVGEAAQNGVGAVLMLAALISVNLAVINLIPIPALDGGRLFLLIIEALFRRPAPRLAVQLLNAVGIAAIIFLMVAVTYHDVARLLV
jgi:regulator of sigma E protease